MCLHLTGFFFGFDSKLFLRGLTDIDNMTETNAITEGLFKELLTSVKTLQVDVAALKSSGAIGGNNPPTDKSGYATLPENSNETGGNSRKRQ